MKYKIKNSDLFMNNKLHPEGSEVDLTKEQTKGIEDFLIPISSPEFISGTLDISGSSSEVKTNTKNEINSKSKGNKK
jgi:hypothetical protein